MVDEAPRLGEAVTALLLFDDGGVGSLPLATDGGGEFTGETNHAGPWLARVIVSGSNPAYFAVAADGEDVSSLRLRGRRGPNVPASTTFVFDLGLRPWSTFDYVQVTSRSAGTRLDFRPGLVDGAMSFNGTLQPLAAIGGSILSTDDVRISQVSVTSTIPGSAEFSSIVGSVGVSGLLVPGDMLVATLAASPMVATVRLQIDGGAFASTPGARPPFCRLVVEEETAGVRTANAPIVAGGAWTPAGMTRDFNMSNPSGLAVAGEVLCIETLGAPLPLADGGLETNADGGLSLTGLQVLRSSTAHLSLDGGVVREPPPNGPRAIHIDGRVSPVIVSHRPTVSWQAPSSGPALRYEVLIQRLARPFNLLETVATLHTRDQQVRVPPDILLPNERYAFRVTAIFAPAADPSRPFLEALPTTAASGQSAVVIVR